MPLNNIHTMIAGDTVTLIAIIDSCIRWFCLVNCFVYSYHKIHKSSHYVWLNIFLSDTSYCTLSLFLLFSVHAILVVLYLNCIISFLKPNSLSFRTISISWCSMFNNYSGGFFIDFAESWKTKQKRTTQGTHCTTIVVLKMLQQISIRYLYGKIVNAACDWMIIRCE